MSLFRHLTRAWCDLCGHRTLLVRTRKGVCRECIKKAIEQMEKDDEMRSLRGATDAQLERF